ncbi:bacteriocin immunity protein [Enterococcus durans]|uniref:Sakacin-A immunity factor n=1 Tax=Enterococcus durans TaxID=53345 RepID=A0A377KMX9_9ENTE|nr:bacteriocin immunity protein [Enterococcus durans]STP30509.1 Sakacin-A immunity factor [Enterococcus durans]
MVNKNDQVDRIIELTSLALSDTDIQNDEELSALLNRIRNQALDREVFYDYKKEFDRYVVGFTIRNHFQVPKVLLDLLAIIRRPSGWSGL